MLYQHKLFRQEESTVAVEMSDIEISPQVKEEEHQDDELAELLDDELDEQQDKELDELLDDILVEPRENQLSSPPNQLMVRNDFTL